MLDRGRLILALLAGLLTTLAFPPFGFWPGVILGPALLLVGLRGLPPRRAALLGWCFGFSHFLSGVWWVVISTHVFGGGPLPVALGLLLCLAAYLALFPALAALLLNTFTAHPGPVALLLLWPACWLLGEFARDLIFGGFPWFSLGYVATAIPRGLNLSAVVGVHGVSVLLALLAGALVALLTGQRRWPVVLAVVMLLAGLGRLPAPGAWTQAAAQPLRVALIQGNVTQDQKWRPENRGPTIALYQEMTEQAWPADLVIWPEVAIPLPWSAAQWFFEVIDEQAKAQQGTVFGGVLTGDGGKYYNTVYALGLDSGRYVKRHLVPFGEYIPAPDWVRPLFDVLNLPFPAIATGLSGQPTLSVKGQQVSLSICFEDVFPLEVRETAMHSGLLVNVTNDAWFAGSGAPEQHLQIARLRAAESGRSLLRVANTGISAVIGPDGQIQQQLDWGQRGILRAEVLPRVGLTPYQRWGRAPLHGFVVVVLLLGLLWRRGLLPYPAFSQD